MFEGNAAYIPLPTAPVLMPQPMPEPDSEDEVACTGTRAKRHFIALCVVLFTIITPVPILRKRAAAKAVPAHPAPAFLTLYASSGPSNYSTHEDEDDSFALSSTLDHYSGFAMSERTFGELPHGNESAMAQLLPSSDGQHDDTESSTTMSYGDSRSSRAGHDDDWSVVNDINSNEDHHVLHDTSLMGRSCFSFDVGEFTCFVVAPRLVQSLPLPDYPVERCDSFTPLPDVMVPVSIDDIEYDIGAKTVARDMFGSVLSCSIQGSPRLICNQMILLLSRAATFAVNMHTYALRRRWRCAESTRKQSALASYCRTSGRAPS